MNDFLISSIKGTYPYFFLPALGVSFFIYSKGRWKKEYTLLWGVYAAGMIGVMMQIFCADRILYVSRRYLLPFAPVLFGFTAWGMIQLKRKLPTRTFYFLGGLFIIIMYYDALTPILKNYTSVRRRAEQRDFRAMASIIISECTERPKQTKRNIWWYEPRIPGTCVIKDATAELLWLTGGEPWNEFFPDVRFQYQVVSKKNQSENKKLILLYSGERYLLYKRPEEANE